MLMWVPTNTGKITSCQLCRRRAASRGFTLLDELSKLHTQPGAGYATLQCLNHSSAHSRLPCDSLRVHIRTQIKCTCRICVQHGSAFSTAHCSAKYVPVYIWGSGNTRVCCFIASVHYWSLYQARSWCQRSAKIFGMELTSYICYLTSGAFGFLALHCVCRSGITHVDGWQSLSCTATHSMHVPGTDWPHQ
jgi:hypothetical protein